MNSALEQGLKSYLAAQLTAADTTIGSGEEAFTVKACTISGKSVSLHCNISADRMPLDRSWIVIGVPDIPRVVGKLHDATVLISICTPSEDSTITDAHHRAIVAAVRACFPDLPSRYQARAAAESPEQIAATQAALDAALAKVVACGTALAAQGFTISATSPWFQDATRDGIAKDLKRWESITALKLAVNTDS